MILMTNTERKVLNNIIGIREDSALNRLKHNPEYLKLCEQQEKTESIVKEMLHSFSEEDLNFLYRYYDGETEKQCFELNAVYLQGMRDSAKILAMLGILDKGISL